MTRTATVRFPASVFAALLAALVWHSFFFLFRAPDREPHPRPLRTRLTYFPVAGDEGAAARKRIRAVWSPVLFSLPSELGFSRRFLESRGERALSFSFDRGVLKENLLAGPAAAAVENALAGPEPDAKVFQVPSPLSALAEPVDFPSPPQAGPEQVRIRFEPVLRMVETPDFAGAMRGLPGGLVEADLEVDEEGRVRHVFIRPGSTGGTAILPLLYRIKFEAGGSGRRTAVILEPAGSGKGAE